MIRTCLFDMGNVLVFFSHDRMCEQLGRLSGLSAAEIRQLLIESEVQWDFERGRLTTSQFHDWFRSATKPDISLDELTRAASDIFWLNDPIVPILDQLKERGIRLVLLSNTCQPHFDWVREHFSVLQRFDECVTSCDVGAMKPEPEIYRAALKRIDCDPTECFYTDDIPRYVAAGREHGLQAEVFTDVPNLLQQLRSQGVNLIDAA